MIHQTSVGNQYENGTRFSFSNRLGDSGRGTAKSMISHMLVLATEHHSIGMFESYTENDYKFLILKLGSNRHDENVLQYFDTQQVIEIQSGNEKSNVIQSNRHRRDMDVVNIFETRQCVNSKLEKSFLCLFSECSANVTITLDENNLLQSKVFIDIVNENNEIGEGNRYYPSPSPYFQTECCSITSEKYLGVQKSCFEGFIVPKVVSSCLLTFFIPKVIQSEKPKNLNLDPARTLSFDYSKIMTMNESKFVLVASVHGKNYRKNPFVLREMVPVVGVDGQVESCKLKKFHIQNFYKYFTKFHLVLDCTTLSDGKYLFLLRKHPGEKLDTFEHYQSYLLWIVIDLFSCTAKQVFPVHYKKSEIDSTGILRTKKRLDQEGFVLCERKKNVRVRPQKPESNSQISSNIDLEFCVTLFGYHANSVTNRDLFSVLLLFRSNFEDKSLKCHNGMRDVPYHQYTFKFTEEHILPISCFNTPILSDITVTSQH
ncbi:hypothetical protein C9374_010165 [Naegleria lovaniensis]|uniref:Uncharacterized protein n=1 Tax=Naegleria lovaniensis TaxID=51637 RepID=A0AA88GEN2_NAELO|nr:uncharacterized protein C9374_010165 [Naegleria lovaniensis]KAG2375161.1 hypothetical protein C9374_010165 [Naegleria lovaniensis]